MHSPRCGVGESFLFSVVVIGVAPYRRRRLMSAAWIGRQQLAEATSLLHKRTGFNNVATSAAQRGHGCFFSFAPVEN
jgi:hypothetical protein